MPPQCRPKRDPSSRFIANRIVKPVIERDLFFIHSERRSLSKAEFCLKTMCFDMVNQKMAHYDA